MPITTEHWAEFYGDGGPLMHAILVLGVVGFGLVVNRIWRLCVGQRVDARRLMRVVEAHLLAGDTAGALRACPPGRSVVLRVVRAGLLAGVSSERACIAVREQQLEIEPSLSRWLPTLSSIATLVMLVGFLGTVIGMISGFGCVATVSAEVRAASLARGIAMAIHTSGFGILVAVLLLGARLVLVDASGRLLAEVALCGAKVVNLVRLATESPTTAQNMPYRWSADLGAGRERRLVRPWPHRSTPAPAVMS